MFWYGSYPRNHQTWPNIQINLEYLRQWHVGRAMQRNTKKRGKATVMMIIGCQEILCKAMMTIQASLHPTDKEVLPFDCKKMVSDWARQPPGQCQYFNVKAEWNFINLTALISLTVAIMGSADLVSSNIGRVIAAETERRTCLIYLEVI